MLPGGSGVFSYALLRAYPQMEVILGELPAAIPVIEEHFISKKKDPRLSTRTGTGEAKYIYSAYLEIDMHFTVLCLD